MILWQKYWASENHFFDLKLGISLKLKVKSVYCIYIWSSSFLLVISFFWRPTNSELYLGSIPCMLMTLRKICLHPYLFDYPLTEEKEHLIDEDLIRKSGRFAVLDCLLSGLLERNHKVEWLTITWRIIRNSAVQNRAKVFPS